MHLHSSSMQIHKSTVYKGCAMCITSRHHLKLVATSLFLWEGEMVFYPRHPASSGIRRLPLLTRSTQKDCSLVLLNHNSLQGSKDYKQTSLIWPLTFAALFTFSTGVRATSLHGIFIQYTCLIFFHIVRQTVLQFFDKSVPHRLPWMTGNLQTKKMHMRWKIIFAIPQ